jgi:asparagine synthase (glutamine-hydrolysing)
MCGIAGFFLREGPANPAVLREMCRLIQHRGPDDEGLHVDGGCAIGMRRLSIIDLSTGHQPISNEDGSVWVVFNGEIYNYQPLRAELIAKGHRFTTNSDTETLVHLYEQEGADGLSRLRGMFAFAIFDKRRRRLFLARDRFGKKPLYYAALPNGLFFASELKCLLAAEVPSDIDDEALRLYFQFTYIPDPYSPFRAIRKLPGGSWLTYDLDAGVRTGRYWSPPVPVAEPAPGFTVEDARRRVRDVFDESVRIRMIADVPLGAFLSGGIDSSSVVASMALQSSEPVKTFSIGFEESEFNELHYASLVAKKYNTDHHEIIVRPESADLIPRLVRHFDEPFGDSSAIPTYIVSEFTARHVKVALSGDGGDELFAGYERFASAGSIAGFGSIPRPARRLLSWAASQLPYSAYGKNYLHMLSRDSALECYLEANFANYYMRRALLQPQWMLPADGAYLSRLLGDFLLPRDADVLSQFLYFESSVNLPGDMLVKVDRMSMAASLEVRCPALDQDLAELAATIPHAWKMHHGRGKQIFVEAMADRLPPELLNRPKMGFGVPISTWFRGALRSFLWDHLMDQRFLSRNIVSPVFLERMLHEHDTGRRANQQWLWSLLMLEVWFRELEDARANFGSTATHSTVPCRQ